MNLFWTLIILNGQGISYIFSVYVASNNHKEIVDIRVSYVLFIHCIWSTYSSYDTFWWIWVYSLIARKKNTRIVSAVKGIIVSVDGLSNEYKCSKIERMQW